MTTNQTLPPGMRVRVVNHNPLGGHSRNGRIGTLSRISSIKGYAYVDLDRTPRERSDKTELFSFDQIEVLADTTEAGL